MHCTYNRHHLCGFFTSICYELEILINKRQGKVNVYEFNFEKMRRGGWDVILIICWKNPD